MLLAVAGVMALASCDTKECRCYNYQNNRWTGPFTYGTAVGTPCRELNNPNRYCNEMDDPIIDPNDIAIGKKK